MLVAQIIRYVADFGLQPNQAVFGLLVVKEL
jgi:hypothetical protein